MQSSSRLDIAFSHIGHSYSHLFMLLFPTVVLALEVEFNRPYSELITLALVGFIMFGAGALPAGWLADRWSERGMMALFFLGLGASAVLTGLAQSTTQIAAGLASMGLFASIYHPVGIALLVKHARRRGRALGINGIFGNTGTAVAALVAGALTDLIHWRAAFIVPGIVALATGVVFMMAVGGDGKDGAPEHAGRERELSRKEFVRTMIVLSVTLLCSGLIYQITSVALPKVFAVRVTDFQVGGALGVGGLVSAVYFLASLLQVAGGIAADRLPLKFVYVMAYVIQVPVLMVAAFLSGGSMLVIVFVAVSLNIAAAPAESALIAQYSPAKWRATAFGAKFAVSLGPSALGVPLVAMIYEGTGGFFWLFITLAGLAGMLVAAALFLPGERRGASLSTMAAKAGP